MKTEDLKALGLTDEQIKSVMALNGKAIQAEQDKAKAEADSLTAERDDFKKQLEGRDKDLKELKKSAGDNAELKKQYEDLQSKYKTDTEKLNETLAKTKLDSAISEALGQTKARDPKDLKNFLNMENIKLTDNGLIGLDEQVKNLQENKAYLFASVPKTSGTNPVGGQTPPASDSFISALGLAPNK